MEILSAFDAGGLIIVILIIVGLITAAKGIMIVEQATVKMVERLGKFHKVARSGINFIWPYLDKVRPFVMRDRVANYLDLREQVMDFPPSSVITRDNVTMEVDAVLYYQITDPVKATYEITDLGNAIVQLTVTSLRNVMGELALDETLTSRETVNVKLRDVLDEATDKWGVKVNRVELKNIEPPNEIRDAMAKQMKAERERRAVVTEAEGTKKSAVLEAEGKRDAAIAEAEGEKRSTILEAEGIAEARLRIAEAEAEALKRVRGALNEANPANYLIALKYLESLEKVSAGQATKIFLPFEASGILGSLGGIREMLRAEETAPAKRE
ncbi:MAG: SPFH domain-containing protein [Acidiferrobacterales bacterium]